MRRSELVGTTRPSLKSTGFTEQKSIEGVDIAKLFIAKLIDDARQNYSLDPMLDLRLIEIDGARERDRLNERVDTNRAYHADACRVIEQGADFIAVEARIFRRRDVVHCRAHPSGRVNRGVSGTGVKPHELARVGKRPKPIDQAPPTPRRRSG